MTCCSGRVKLYPFHCGAVLTSVMFLSLASFVISVERDVAISEAKVQSKSSIQFITTKSKVFKLIMGETSALRGSLIVGARNYVLRVSPSLIIEDMLQNGPHDDNSPCNLSPSITNSSQLRDNDNHVLILYENGFLVNVLVCGTASHGMCYLLRSTDLNHKGASGCYGNPSDQINHVTSRVNTLAFEIKSKNASDSPSYVIGYEYDRRPLKLSPPTLSVRKVWPEKTTFHYLNSNSHNSTIDLNANYKESWSMNFRYGFYDDNYYYIISNQRLGPDSYDFEARIARVCLNDTSMTTYTETPIKCEQSFVYNIITAGHYANVSTRMAAHLQVPSDSDILYLSFAASESQKGFSLSNLGSAVCALSLQQLNQHLDKAIGACMSGDRENVFLHPAFTLSGSTNCINLTVNNHCTPRSTDAYILTEDAIILQPIITLPADNISSLVTYTVKESTIALIGTQEGKIMKSTLTYPPEVLFEETFLSQNVTDADTSVQRDPVIDKNSTFAYFAVENNIVKFPLQSCSIYTKCSRCINSNDPLNCGWCGNRCAHSGECATATSRDCIPVIYDFHPKSGPIEGSTEITIIGDNFGHAQSGTPADVSVLTSSSKTIKCYLKKRENEKIICDIEASGERTSGKLEIRVNQPANSHYNYSINGKGTSEADYTFEQSNVTKIHPPFGPQSGGVKLHLFGQHLDSGSRRTIRILTSDLQSLANCSVDSVQPSEITCITSKSSHEINSVGYLSLTIDNTIISTGLNYTLTSNPTISSISPSGAPLSAKLEVHIVGSNLDSIAVPILNISRSDELVSVPCTTVTNELIKCPLPQFDESWVHTRAKLLLTNDHMIVDTPLNFDFAIHPDPQFFKLTLDDTVSLADRVLTLRGNHISQDYPIVITLGHDKFPCEKIEVRDHYVKCRIEFTHSQPSVNDTLTVSYSIGQLEGHVSGFVTFTDQASSSEGFNWFIFIVILIISAASVITWFLFKRNRIEKVLPHVVYRNQPSTPVQNDYSNNAQLSSEVTPLMSSVMMMIDEESLALLRSSNKLIAVEYLTLGEKVGEGHFGEVFKGTLQAPDGDGGVDVAVKTLQLFGDKPPDSLIREALVMKDFDHKNVMKLTGLVFPERSAPLLVLPFMCNGDLLRYVRDENREPSLRELLKFSLDIARGMEYLAAQKFVHRDLAARNCMLDENLDVRVADFGLSRDVYEKGYYKPELSKPTPLPYKWMAPESLKMWTFTTKSDVWSYGVTSWEIITRGFIPYSMVENRDLQNHLDSGMRLERPAYCPELIYNLWLRCWSYDSTERPTFVEIVAEIEQYIKYQEQRAAAQHDVVYRNVASGRYYNVTVDGSSSSQASSSHQTDNSSKPPAEVAKSEATSL